MAAKRDIYMGGEDGLYRATLNGGVAQADKAGLGGMGRVRSVLIDKLIPGRVFAATNERGVWRSDDGGATWQQKVQNIVYLEGWSLAQDVTSGAIYHGTGPATVYKSEDGGESWQDLRQFKTMHEMEDWTFPLPPFIPHVKQLSVSPNDPHIVLGAVEEGWIVRSDDSGKTWRNLKNGSEFDAHTVLALPGGDEVVMTSGKGVFRSEDGGETFEPSNTGIERKYLAHVSYHPDRPDRLFTAGAEGYPGLWRRRPEGALSEFYRSLDAGRTWKRMTGGVPDAIHGAARATAVAPDDADTVAIGLGDGTVWMSEDGGDNWTKVVEGAAPIYELALGAR